MKTIRTITRESFAPYGSLLAFSPEPENDLFEIVVREQKEPWRIAMLRVVRRAAERLERHPGSMETFEPVSGVSVLLVADPATPDNWEAFLLDQPVCVGKGVWHEIITLSEESLCKLTENLDVECVYHPLAEPVAPYIR